MDCVTASEAKTHVGQLLERVACSDEIKLVCSIPGRAPPITNDHL